MSGPPPKPAHLRQRTNKKSSHATLEMPDSSAVPAIPNPDARVWHPLTVQAWKKAWQSPMSTQWVEADLEVLGRLAMLWDAFYHKPHAQLLAEIRLQEQRFGLSPLDRSRLQWEVSRAEGAEQKHRRPEPAKRHRDPRTAFMMAVK